MIRDLKTCGGGIEFLGLIYYTMGVQNVHYSKRASSFCILQSIIHYWSERERERERGGIEEERGGRITCLINKREA